VGGRCVQLSESRTRFSGSAVTCGDASGQVQQLRSQAPLRCGLTVLRLAGVREPGDVDPSARRTVRASSSERRLTNRLSALSGSVSARSVSYMRAAVWPRRLARDRYRLTRPSTREFITPFWTSRSMTVATVVYAYSGSPSATSRTVTSASGACQTRSMMRRSAPLSLIASHRQSVHLHGSQAHRGFWHVKPGVLPRAPRSSRSSS
jgi:hypothetical protein